MIQFKDYSQCTTSIQQYRDIKRNNNLVKTMNGITNIQNIVDLLRHVVQGGKQFKNIFRYQKEFSRLFKASINRFINSGQNCQQHINSVYEKAKDFLLLHLYSGLKDKKFGPEHYQYINYLFKKQVPKCQSVKKLIDQNKKILKKDQSSFTKLANSQIQIPNVCLCCLSQVDSNQQLIENQNQKIFPIEKFVLNEPQNDQILKKYICSMLNAGQGLIMIGVSKQLKVKGLQLQNSQILQIKQKIKDIRKSWIFPEYQQNQQKQIFRLQVIQVSPNTNQILQEPQKPSYIIKIYANTRGSKKAYFVKQKINKVSQVYTMHIDPTSIQGFVQQRSYLEIHNKSKQKHWQLTHPYIQNKEKQISSNNSIQVPLQQNNENQIETNLKSYGKIPEKFYAYHSIVVAQNKGDKFRLFTQKVNKDMQCLKYCQIYQKFISNTTRTVYYMTHRQKYDQIKLMIQKEDPKRKNLVLMKIKPHLTLLKQQYFNQAYQKLKQRFQLCFKKELKVIHSKSKKSGKQQEHFFCFDNQNEAIFAFTLLQNSNIRSNFISQQKIREAKLQLI